MSDFRTRTGTVLPSRVTKKTWIVPIAGGTDVVGEPGSEEMRGVSSPYGVVKTLEEEELLEGKDDAVMETRSGVDGVDESPQEVMKVGTVVMGREDSTASPEREEAAANVLTLSLKMRTSSSH